MQAYAARVPELVAFLGVAAVVICTPGQDTALTIRNALLGGRRSGAATALGVAVGQAGWTVAAAAGVTALVAASQPAFLALKLVGAAYLVLLGLQSLRHALSLRGRLPDLAGPRSLAPQLALRQGLVSNLANPKMAVFFTSLLPQFGETFLGLVALGLAFAALTFAWLAAYGVAVARARRVLERARVRRLLDGLSGAVLVGLGVRVAASR